MTRGDVVEATHLVHAATTDGETWGDPSLAFCLRSAAKPIQAIPFVEGYDDLADEEIAIACASHHAEPAQLDAVRRVLAPRRRDRRRSRERHAGRPARREARPQLLGQARRDARRLPARTAGRSTPTATPAIRCSTGSPTCSGDEPSGGRRLRRPDLHDDARRGGARCSPSRRPGSARRCVHARARRRLARRRRHRPDAARRRLDRKGRRGGASLRRPRGRPRPGAQVRGRRVPRAATGARRRARPRGAARDAGSEQPRRAGRRDRRRPRWRCSRHAGSARASALARSCTGSTSTSSRTPASA